MLILRALLGQIVFYFADLFNWCFDVPPTIFDGIFLAGLILSPHPSAQLTNWPNWKGNQDLDVFSQGGILNHGIRRFQLRSINNWNCKFVCRTPLFSRTMIPERNCLLQNHSVRSLLSAFTPGDLISHCSHSNESLAIASRPQWHIWLTVCSSKAVLWTFGRLKARSQQSFQLHCTDGRKDIATY